MRLTSSKTFRLGSGSAALEHLKASRILMREALSLPEARFSSKTKKFLAERLMYMIAVSHITMGCDSDGWVVRETTDLRQLVETSSSTGNTSSSGYLHDLIEHVPAVSILARRRHEEKAAGVYTSDTAMQLQAIRARILLWRPNTLDAIQNSCGTVYQQALLAYIACACPTAKLDANSEDLSMATVDQAFSVIMPIVSSIPQNSPVANMLCWPLAILGSCAQKQGHRNFITGYFDILCETYASESLRDTQGLLLKLWHYSGTDRLSPLDFADMMKQEKMTVLFL